MRHLTTLILKAVFAVLFVCVGSKTLLAEQLIDRIVAVVNGEPILHSEIQKKIDTGFIVTVSAFPAEESDADEVQALQDAINSQLILQKAEEMEIEFDNADVESEIDQNLQMRGTNREGLMMALRQQGMSFEEYKDDFRRQMIFRRFQGMVIRPMVKITERDIESYYIRQSGGASANLTLTMRQILFRVSSDAVSEIADGKQKLAREVYQKLRAGMDFTEAVNIYSDDSQARTSGGVMANVKLNDLAPQIRQAIENLEVGEFSRPVQTSLGFHIFLLEDKQFGSNVEFQRQRQRLETELLILESDLQTRRWLADQRKRSDVNIID